jgi:hypothetical protein
MGKQNRKVFWGTEMLYWGIITFVLGICVFVVIQNSTRRRYPSGAGCINNLRQIDAAANQFALEHSLTNGSRISFPNDLTPYIKLNSAGKIPPCPGGGIYHISKVGEIPTCSLSNTVTPSHILP